MVSSPLYTKSQVAKYGYMKHNNPSASIEHFRGAADCKNWESCYDEVINYYLTSNSTQTGIRAFYSELRKKQGTVTPEWVIFKMIKHGILKEFMLDD